VTFDQLAELVRREEEAVDGRRFDELIAIQQEQLELLDALPDELPREALPLLEQALARCLSTQQSLFASLAETKGIIERLRAGRRAIGGYTTNQRGKVDARA
jgi:hypothetical protein